MVTDNRLVIILAWIYAFFFALCGIGLAVAGVYAGGSGLMLGVALGVFVAGGAVPFIRSARRLHNAVETAPVDDESCRSRRRTTRRILGASAVLALTTLVLPVPTVVRGIFIATILLVVPLALIGESDDAKRR